MEKQEEQEFESRLVPILREGVEIVRMILFKELQGYVLAKYADRDKSFANRLTGAVVNDLFGTENTEPAFAAFVRENRAAIDQTVNEIATHLEHLRIPVTDALRIIVLCNHQDGIDSSDLLRRAEEIGVLLTEREMPMPHTFIELVRRLGESFGLLSPPTETATAPDAQ